jgi:hypothetical protein
LVWGRSRRGSASGVAAVVVAVMLVASGISGAVIYFSMGGSSPVVGAGSPSGALSSPAPANLTSEVGELSGGLSNSTLGNLTASLAGQVRVAASSLPADYFAATGTTSSFTCSAAPSAAYLAVVDDGNGSASVASVSIALPQGVTDFSPSGACSVGPAGPGEGTTYILFPANSQLSLTPLSDSYYAGAVSLSDGAIIPFEGIWQ